MKRENEKILGSLLIILFIISIAAASHLKLLKKSLSKRQIKFWFLWNI